MARSGFPIVSKGFWGGGAGLRNLLVVVSNHTMSTSKVKCVWARCTSYIAFIRSGYHFSQGCVRLVPRPAGLRHGHVNTATLRLLFAERGPSVTVLKKMNYRLGLVIRARLLSELGCC